ncbi:hypothetical protein [Streptomyces lavendulocolor]|uniref:hypothetical protein n=1 Tax=Streptomyces lavendulocolor TaxID=67316 RepID=UPI0031DDC14E
MLQRAGFCLLDAADDVTPGMRVSNVPSGVLIHWTALGGRSEQNGAHVPGGHSESIVRAAVLAVLTGHGLCVLSSGAAGDLIVLPPDQARFRT